MSHQVSVLRRSGDSWSPVLDYGQVKPGEPIRLSVRNVGSFVEEPRFLLVKLDGQVLIDERIDTGFDQRHDIDIAAPASEDIYYFAVQVKTFFFIDPHTDIHYFEVSQQAPDPPPPPPGKGDDLLFLAKAGIVVVGLLAVSNLLGQILGRR